MRVSEPRDILAELISEGVLDRGITVDVDYYALRLHVDATAVRTALEQLVVRGYLHAQDAWKCSECDAETSVTQSECSDCERPRNGGNLVLREYVRPLAVRSRDPSAVFLIHGMNTLGDWQESFAWKLQLLYGYSIPVFVFKFGRDRLSPLTRYAQNRRTNQLATAVMAAQADLEKAGRNTRCDVIAHSFGTLLFTRLLERDSFQALEFGRVILTGSIAPRSFRWKRFIASGRVEAVLNHRAGEDFWVKIAPCFFPNVGASGLYGFIDAEGIEDFLSPGFEHSDYFTSRNFDSVIRLRWSRFLEGQEYFSPRIPPN